jgi:energy-converting hydrogenase Eha subunit A
MILTLPMVNSAPERPKNPWAVSAFTLSLVSWIGFPIPIISMGLAWIALREMEQRGESGRAMAQFARAFAILVTVAIALRSGHTDWLAMAHR